MNEWSDFANDWQQLEPDLTPLIKRTRRRGRWLQGYFWYQLVGTFIAIPIWCWALWVTDNAAHYGIIFSATGFVAGWWAAAWPIWKDLRRERPPARPRAVLANALRHIRSGRRLAQLEMGVGIALIVLMGLIWSSGDHSRNDQLIIAGGAAIAALWFLMSWRYWRRLGREADALLGRSK